jgi:hypothetical protein
VATKVVAVMVGITMDTVTNKKTQWGGESCPICYLSSTANWLPSSESSFA